MNETNIYTQELKSESLRKALIGVVYDMVSPQAEDMAEDIFLGSGYMINE